MTIDNDISTFVVSGNYKKVQCRYIVKQSADSVGRVGKLELFLLKNINVDDFNSSNFKNAAHKKEEVVHYVQIAVIELDMNQLRNYLGSCVIQMKWGISKIGQLIVQCHVLNTTVLCNCYHHYFFYDCFGNVFEMVFSEIVNHIVMGEGIFKSLVS